MPSNLRMGVMLACALIPGAAAQSADAIAQQAYLKASNTELFDAFGASVAVSGNTLVVGAPNEDSAATGVNGDQSSNTKPASGAAYVFVRTGSGWMQQAYLKAARPTGEDAFAAKVAISGDTIVVGSPNEDSSATGVNGDQLDEGALNSGAAYVFVRSGTTWSQQAYLKASNTGVFDLFGGAVAVAGDIVVVGALGEASSATGVNGNQADETAGAAGAAYVFTRSGTTWTQQAYLKASNAEANDWFGASLAVAGDTVLVGAVGEDSGAAGVNGGQGNGALHLDSGASYVFARAGTSWSQQAYLKASNTGAGDHFGVAVALAEDTAVIGAPGEQSAATGVDCDQADDTLTTAGAAYVFARSGRTWSQQAYLKASSTDAGDIFGAAVAASGDAVAVGSKDESSGATGVNGNQADDSADGAGAAWVFTRSGAAWSPLAYLKASNTDAHDQFGLAVGLDGDSLVSGATGESSGATGANGDQDDDTQIGAGAAYAFDLGLDPWTNLGSGKAGSSGAPLLTGTGPLSAGSGNQLDLTSAHALSSAMLVVGLARLDAAFKGGTLVPVPLVIVPLATNGSGATSLPFVWPASLPPGISVFFQFWIGDPGASFGLSASNGLQAVSA